MSPVDVRSLLETDAWIRRLARRLVASPEQAEDLAQDAWVVALDRDRSGGSERRYLTGVVRNLFRGFARGEERRVRREREVAAGGEVASSDELVGELTLRRELTTALLELEEPYRRTLWLRFFQNRSVARIAREEGVPGSTVHDRVQSGLVRLRSRLDRAYAGDRQAWSCALLAVAKPTSFGSAALVSKILGGIAMGTGTKVAVCATLVVGGTLAWVYDSGEATTQAEAGPMRMAAVVEVADQAPLAVLEAAPVSAAREEVVEPSTPVEATPAAAARTGPVGRVIDVDGTPVGDVAIGRVDANGALAGRTSARTDAAGRFELPPEEDAGHWLGCLDANWTTLVFGTTERDAFDASSDGIVVVVARRAAGGGTVVDVLGRPIEGAELSFVVRQSLFRSLGIARPYPLRLEAWNTTSDAQGHFDLDRIAGGLHVVLNVRAAGFLEALVELPGGGRDDLVVTLERDVDGVELFGLVQDFAGRPVPGASVSAGQQIVETDGEGRFALVWKLEGQGMFAKDEDDVWRAEGDTSTLVAVKAGFLPARYELDEPDPRETIVLRLGPAALELAGRVVDPDGRPIEGAIVWARDLSPFGSVSVGSTEGKAVFFVSLEETIRGGQHKRGCGTDAAGRFRLTGLVERDYELVALDPASATRGGPWTLRPGGGEVELVLVPEAETWPVRGRIVDALGAPIVGVSVRAQRSRIANVHEDAPRLAGFDGSRTTDEDGRFAFAALATRGTVLELQHEAFFLRHVELDGRDDLDDMEIVQPRLCELRVDLGAERDLADELRVLDDAGRPLMMLESHGVFLSLVEEVDIVAGSSSIVRVNETAHTLVLLREGEEVLRRALRLDPGEVTVFRP